MKRARRARRRRSGRTGVERKKVNKLVVLAICLGVLVVSGFIVLGLSMFFEPGSEIPIAPEVIQPVEKEAEKVNVLVLGVDKKGMLTDTIIIASYDLAENNVKMLSIPRDTRIRIGNGYQKINAAYSIAHKSNKNGAEGSIEAVSRMTGIPIHYYVKFKTTAFRDLIDALGGVDFDVPQRMYYQDPEQDLYIDLKKGFQHLDGDKAEQLVRFRMYKNGDIDRVNMQQKFITAVAEQHLNVGIVTKIPELFETIQENIETNASLADITKYVPDLMGLDASNIKMLQVPGGFNETDYGASYWIVDMPALRTLVEEEFEYDASEATTGRPGSKDEEQALNRLPQGTPKPSEDPDERSSDDEDDDSGKPSKSPTAKPTSTAKPTASVKPGSSSKPTASVAPTKKPTTSPKPTQSEDPDEEEPTEKPTEKPSKTSSPTAEPESKPTAKPTASPKAEEPDEVIQLDEIEG